MECVVRELTYLENFALEPDECRTLALLLQGSRAGLEAMKVG